MFTFSFLFLADPAPVLVKLPVAACMPLPVAQGEPDGWLLLAALVVCTAGRLARPPRRAKKSR